MTPRTKTGEKPKAAGKAGAVDVEGLSSFAREVAGGLREAIGYVQGKGTARVTTVDVPDPAPQYKPSQVARIRGELGLTQVRFARLMNVSTTSVEGWESGTKSPGPASRRLLQMVSDEKTLSAVAGLRGLRIVRAGRAAKAATGKTGRPSIQPAGKGKQRA